MRTKGKWYKPYYHLMIPNCTKMHINGSGNCWKRRKNRNGNRSDNDKKKQITQIKKPFRRDDWCYSFCNWAFVCSLVEKERKISIAVHANVYERETLLNVLLQLVHAMKTFKCRNKFQRVMWVCIYIFISMLRDISCTVCYRYFFRSRHSSDEYRFMALLLFWHNKNRVECESNKKREINRGAQLQ